MTNTLMDEDFAALVLKARGLLDAFKVGRLKLATAESCTGGLIAAILTEVPGSSVVLERGFVTYSNEAKTEMLGVPAELIGKHGAVSEPVARAMAQGAIAHSRADISVSVTGIAGPDGGSAEKPVGEGRGRPPRASPRRSRPAAHPACERRGSFHPRSDIDLSV
jgi:PncC family amidohydrolase